MDFLQSRATVLTISWLARNAVVIALVLLIAAFAAMTDRFFTVGNARVVLIQSSVIAILAVPSALLLMSGYLDLAIGSIAGLCGVILGLALQSWSLPIAIVVTLLVAAIIGLLQGVLSTHLQFPFLVVTLGFFTGVRGIALLVSGGQLTSGFGEALRWLGRGRVTAFDIPVPVIIAVVAFAVGFVFLYQTRWGRHVMAIGNNPTVAFRSGIRVHLIPALLYMGTAIAAGIAAIIMVARLNATPPTLGEGLELQVLTAVLLGGVAFGGGRGSLVGVGAGVLFVGVLTNGLIHLGVPPFWSPVSVGIALVFAAGLDALSRRVEERRMSVMAHTPSSDDTTADEDEQVDAEVS